MGAVDRHPPRGVLNVRMPKPLDQPPVLAAVLETRLLVTVEDHLLAGGRPVYVIAEIGINHKGSIELAKRLIDGAELAGADAVKF